MNTLAINTILWAKVDDVEIPDIAPDFTAPWMTGFQLIASYILATCLILAFIALILAIIGVVFSSVVPERASAMAGAALPKLALGVVALGCISGIFQWAVNFDFGF